VGTDHKAWQAHGNDVLTTGEGGPRASITSVVLHVPARGERCVCGCVPPLVSVRVVTASVCASFNVGVCNGPALHHMTRPGSILRGVQIYFILSRVRIWVISAVAAPNKHRSCKSCSSRTRPSVTATMIVIVCMCEDAWTIAVPTSNLRAHSRHRCRNRSDMPHGSIVVVRHHACGCVCGCACV
jgi:hypothetical protein